MVRRRLVFLPRWTGRNGDNSRRKKQNRNGIAAKISLPWMIFNPPRMQNRRKNKLPEAQGESLKQLKINV
jgi:hypothetical protein